MSQDNPIMVALEAGRKAFRAGDFESALEACLQVLEFVPNHPLAHMMAGFAQQAAGNPEKAIRHLRFALAHDPVDMDTRDALAMCLLERGRHAEALPHLRQVVAAQPENANARYNLGRCLLDLRNFVEAERVYSEHIERNPGDAEAFNHLGLARLAKGSASEAEPCFRSAIKLNDMDPLFHVNLAQALAHLGQMQESGVCYERAIELDSTDPGLRVQHGWFLITIGNLSLAEDRFREALQRAPEHEGASAGLAAALERRREVKVGLQLLRPFISAVHPHPKVAISYATLSRRESKPEQALPVIRRAIRPGVHRKQVAALRFAEGDLLDAMGDVDAAFDAYQRANEAQGSRYNAEAHEAFVSDLISVFTPELFASIPKPDLATESSVLVCGMPRSGSSLVEQILATHPDIHGAGELDDLSTIAAGLKYYIAGEESYPALVGKIDSELVNRLAQARMESLQRTSDKPLVIDKLPHNFMNLGLAAIITPGVRVIHTVRDPVDTCLSCYFQHFGGPSFTFSNKLEALSSFYKQYRRLMAHWEAVLPVDIHTVRYEDMVAETKKTSQEVLAFLGCEWDDSVLNFHMNERIVATASYAQVREPIYSSSIGRAERYRHRIGALVSLAQLQM
jgi:tetratricopeptide (TPR) repeat protein